MNFSFEKGNHSNHISTNFHSGEVGPKQEKTVTIFFHPRILGDHKIELPLFIDGKKTHVTIYGKAVPLKLNLVNQLDKFVDFGSVLVGKTVTKTVAIRNESECPVEIVFNFLERLPKRTTKEMPDESLELPQEEKKEEKKKKKHKKGSKKGSKGKSSKSSKKKSKKGSSKKSKSTGKKSKKSKSTKSKSTGKKSKKSKSTGKKSKKSSKGSKKSKKLKKLAQPET